MRSFRFVLPLLLFLLLPFTISCAQARPVDAPIAQQAAHHIRFEGMNEWRGCSATAVGPHTLVSAAHCVLGTGQIVVDEQVRSISAMTFDEWDHFLVVVGGPAFPRFLQIDEREVRPGEHVQIWGWPGSATKAIHRDGVLLSVLKDDDEEEWQWELPAYHGDSGAGLISDDNKVISVVSRGNESAWSGSYPFQFSATQLQSIQ